nr:hypothetical protein [Tanacetum cinerariifolium]
MLGSEYGEQDRKAAVLYKVETVCNNDETEQEFMDINIDALYNILKQNQGDVNDAMGSKKKTVVVTFDPLALIAEKTNVSKSKEKVVVSSDSEGSEVNDFSELKKITALLAKAKATVLYEYETFKATKGELLLDTYIRYLQVINDLKECGYFKDNCELNFKFLNNLQPEWKQYATMMRQNKNLMDINIDALYNILKNEADDFSELRKITALLAKAFNRRKFYSKPTNNNLRTSSSSQSANKKQEFLKTDNKRVEKKDDEKKRDMSKVKCYNCKKEGHFAKYCKKAKIKDYNYYKTKMLLAKKDSDEQVLLAEDQAWMESSSDSDQEINANMVFMAQFEKVLSDSDESSSSTEETITEELAEYINSLSWNRPTFYDNDEEHSIQYKEYLERSSNAITTVLPTKEPEYSLSMRYKHLSTIPKTKSDKVIKSIVKNLVQIPSEYEVTSDDESECDVPVKDESSQVFTTFSNPIFDYNNDFTSSDDESLSNEDVPMENFKIYSNPLFDDEEINSDKIDPHYFNAESDLIESLSNRDTLFDSSPKFDYLEEFSGELMPTGIINEERIKREHEEYISLMEKLLTINSFPCSLENVHANTIIELFPHLLSHESDDYDTEGDIHFLEELPGNDSIPLPENESSNFDHHDDPSFPRPLPEPSNVEVFFDFGPIQEN